MIYVEAISRKKKEKMESMRAEALDKARKVALLLKEKYGAGKVILFGSLVSRTYLHEKSDIDLLVEGLKDSDFLHAGFDACVIADPFDVDIIPFEKAAEDFLKAASASGLEL